MPDDSPSVSLSISNVGFDDLSVLSMFFLYITEKKLINLNHARIKQKDFYLQNFFYTMLDSDVHFVLQGVLQIMIMAGWILITLVKSRENIFEYNLHVSLEVIEGKQLSSQKYAT